MHETPKNGGRLLTALAKLRSWRTGLAARKGLELRISANKAESDVGRAEAIARRQTYVDRLLADSPATIEGYCVYCAKAVAFEMRYKDGKPALRESAICPECGLICRLRAFFDLFGRELAEAKGEEVYIGERITPLFRRLSARLPGLIGSEYLGSTFQPGQVDERGIRHEDFTALSFEEGSLSHVLSFECLEHIPDYRAALREAFRVLKPGGKLILSAPFMFRAETLVRATVGPDGEVTHHEKPDYHGDPLVGGNSCLCYYYFGFDLLDEMREIGFERVAAIEYWSKVACYLQTNNQAYITAVKPSRQ